MPWFILGFKRTCTLYLFVYIFSIHAVASTSSMSWGDTLLSAFKSTLEKQRRALHINYCTIIKQSASIRWQNIIYARFVRVKRLKTNVNLDGDFTVFYVIIEHKYQCLIQYCFIISLCVTLFLCIDISKYSQNCLKLKNHCNKLKLLCMWPWICIAQKYKIKIKRSHIAFPENLWLRIQH